MKDFGKIARMIAVFGQLGFTIVTPPVVLALGAHALCSRFGVGSWIMLPAILLGFLASASGAYQFYRRVVSSGRKKEETDDVVFYHHE